MTNELLISGIDLDELDRVVTAGIDHGENAIEAFTDPDGGWPLRCCLSDSMSGDRIAILAWSPFEWDGPYRETGPVVVHVENCPRTTGHLRLPDEFDRRAMTLRPYDHDKRIAYRFVRHIDSGGSLTDELRDMLSNPEIDFVHGRNVTGGCFSFEARR